MTPPVTEAQRLHLFKTFEGLLPDEDVATLMAILPPVDWPDVATKTDLRAQLALTKTDLEAQLALTKSDLQVEIADLRVELHDGLQKQTTRYVGWMLASNTALVTAVGVIVSAAG